MPYPPILRDINGDPLPQVWDKEIGNWRPVTGDDYGQRVRILGADGHPIDTDNPLYVGGSVSVKGSDMEYYGATVEQRPEATEVPVGAAYMAVNTGDVWQSNGFEWVVL